MLFAILLVHRFSVFGFRGWLLLVVCCVLLEYVEGRDIIDKEMGTTNLKVMKVG